MNKENALYQQDLRNIVSMPGIETLHGKTILITGATGMVGTHLIDALMLLGDVKVYAVGRDKNRAMDRLGATKEDTVYVGDSEGDITTSQRAGIPCVCVLWGFRSREELESSGGEIFAEDTAELTAYLLNN